MIIDLLNKDYAVYLESGGHKIKLEVMSTYKGMYSLTQAILEPQKMLRPGKTYTLKIDNLDDWQQGFLRKWDSEKNCYGAVSWIVEDKVDDSVPKILAVPRLVNKSMDHYGCGPAIFADFRLKAEDNSEIFVKTELVDINTGESNIYYLRLLGSDLLKVGHSMCAGAFHFRPEHTYKIRFNFTDICGNSDRTWTDWVEFESPYEHL